MGSQRVACDWVTELNWTFKVCRICGHPISFIFYVCKFFIFSHSLWLFLINLEIHSLFTILFGFPGGSDGKASSYIQYRRAGFDPWVGKIPWRRKWQHTPVFLPGKSHGQRSLAGCSPWGHKRVRHSWTRTYVNTWTYVQSKVRLHFRFKFLAESPENSLRPTAFKKLTVALCL